MEGLKPEKEKHEFYVDISPKFGFPLAIRPKFQLNAIIERDADIEVHNHKGFSMLKSTEATLFTFHLDLSQVMSGFREELLVLPIFWAQDGFSEPSRSFSTQWIVFTSAISRQGDGRPDRHWFESARVSHCEYHCSGMGTVLDTDHYSPSELSFLSLGW